jgi:hypothetical protein
VASVAQAKNPKQAKYANHTQLVQGVCQVDDGRLLGLRQCFLTQAERCFLNCLAAFWVSGDTVHPGNDKLMMACGVHSRQAVRKIAARLVEKKLIEIVAHGHGGRGLATCYRICIEDARFPGPKKKSLPTTEELSVEGTQPTTEELPVNRQLEGSLLTTGAVLPTTLGGCRREIS